MQKIPYTNQKKITKIPEFLSHSATSKEITFIKLGGSVITNKEVPMMVRTEVLNQLALEISQAHKKTGDIYVVGHGQGSFAHAPAMRYRTKEGFVSKDSKIGMAITQDSAAQLNRIVIRAFLSHDLPALSYYASNTLVTQNKQAYAYDPSVFLEYLNQGMMPVTGGDVLVDTSQGCSIWSTELVLGHLAQVAKAHTYSVRSIIHVTEVDGVLDDALQVIPQINQNNKDDVKGVIGDTKGFDVTGGMWHKIEESFALAEQGIPSKIVSGMKKNNLYSLLTGDDSVIHTDIRLV